MKKLGVIYFKERNIYGQFILAMAYINEVLALSHHNTFVFF
jgi:hypothetical protein